MFHCHCIPLVQRETSYRTLLPMPAAIVDCHTGGTGRISVASVSWCVCLHVSDPASKHGWLVGV